MKYRCPLCGSPLTEDHYHRVIKIQEKKEKVQKGELDKLKKQAAAAKAAVAAAKRKGQEIRAKAKQDVEAAKKQVALAERKKNEIRNKRLMARIRKLEEEKEMLQKHTSLRKLGSQMRRSWSRSSKENFLMTELSTPERAGMLFTT